MVSEMEADSLRLSIVIYYIRLSQIPYAHTHVYASLIAIRPCRGENEFILQVMHNEPQLRCGWPFNSTQVIYQKGLHILHESSINLPSQVVSSLEEERLLLLCFFYFLFFFCFWGGNCIKRRLFKYRHKYIW